MPWLAVVLEQGLKLRKEKTLKILTLVAMPVVLEQGLKPVSSNLRRPPSPGLPHGKFLPWIADEFEMSDRTANDFMNVAHRFGGKSAIIADFKPSILYALSAPSTSDSVVEKAIEKAESDSVGITAPLWISNHPQPETKNPDRHMADRGFYLRLAQTRMLRYGWLTKCCVA